LKVPYSNNPKLGSPSKKAVTYRLQLIYSRPGESLRSMGFTYVTQNLWQLVHVTTKKFTKLLLGVRMPKITWLNGSY